MQIDRAAEDLGRTAIRWVGAREKENFLKTLDKIAEADPKLGEEVVRIYVSVGALALRTIYKGGIPSEPQNQEMGEKILAHLPWDLVSLRDVYNLLEGLVLPEKGLSISDRQALISVFMVTGYIVKFYHRGLGYTDPYAFIDDLLNTLVAAPGQ